LEPYLTIQDGQVVHQQQLICPNFTGIPLDLIS